MAVKFGKAFGLKVIIFGTSASKKEESLKLLGADEFVISSDEKHMQVRFTTYSTSYISSNNIVFSMPSNVTKSI